jgi:hypothetical protein
MTKKEKEGYVKALTEVRASVRADILMDYRQDEIPQSIDPRILLARITRSIDKLLASA